MLCRVAGRRMSAQEIAERGCILRAVVGSSAHGLSLDGQDDRDEMGVCLEPPERVIGLRPFDQWEFRTQPNGARSGPGDLDLTIYSLRKWCRLALAGNPTILLPLFVPQAMCSVLTGSGMTLRQNARWFASRYAGRAFLGYMRAQLERLAGDRGQQRVNRPELIERYGYDTKYAAHVLRLGFQGIEYQKSGRLTLPMPEGQREIILSVRRGEFALTHVLATARGLEEDLRRLIETSPLPEEPDRAAVDEFLIDTYTARWGFRFE